MYKKIKCQLFFILVLFTNFNVKLIYQYIFIFTDFEYIFIFSNNIHNSSFYS